MKRHFFNKNKTNMYSEQMTSCGLTEYETVGGLPGEAIRRKKANSLDMCQNWQRVNCTNCLKTRHSH